MPEIVALPGRNFILGETKIIGVKSVRQVDNTSLTGTTASVSIYDSGGSLIVTASMTVSYDATNARVRAQYALATGSGKTITTAGTYRAEYLLTFPDGTIMIWQQALTVKSNPF